MDRMARSPFQLLCRAAVFLARTADLQRKVRDNPEHHLHAVRGLADELHMMNDLAITDYNAIDPTSWLTAIGPWCLTRSALYSLLDKLCCPEQVTQDAGYQILSRAKSDEELGLQTHAFALVQSCAKDLSALMVNIHIALERDGGHQRDNTISLINPLVLDSIYSTAMTWLWIREESGDQSAAWNFDLAQQCLHLLGSRWTLGQEYMGLVKSQEHMAL